MHIYIFFIYYCQYVTDQWTDTSNEAYLLVGLFRQLKKKTPQILYKYNRIIWK